MCFVANFIRFQQCNNFENRLSFDKAIESLKVGIFFESQCTMRNVLIMTLYHFLCCLSVYDSKAMPSFIILETRLSFDFKTTFASPA